MCLWVKSMPTVICGHRVFAFRNIVMFRRLMALFLFRFINMKNG